MTIVTIHEAKTNLSKLLKQVEAGEEIVIARGNAPVARLLPLAAPPTKSRGYGSLKHLTPMPDHLMFDPLPDDEQAAWDGKLSFDP